MKLEAQSSYCELCLEIPPDPNRDDGLCEDCGSISDKYNLSENQLNLESEEAWQIG